MSEIETLQNGRFYKVIYSGFLFHVDIIFTDYLLFVWTQSTSHKSEVNFWRKNCSSLLQRVYSLRRREIHMDTDSNNRYKNRYKGNNDTELRHDRQ